MQVLISPYKLYLDNNKNAYKGSKITIRHWYSMLLKEAYMAVKLKNCSLQNALNCAIFLSATHKGPAIQTNFEHSYERF